ncbi:hypothetical protein [Agrobacterium tumefaciens]|uniref:hypothetical protein n=1 Tax=Agrobacterium tumefaciens TaxID=358 RepID=UPI000200B14D|nr:hypothetical protein [Agrobacterium tumefaciens]ADY66039.1 hypothetical protein AGROH133_09979 [Agrobacterium tumefaciens]
MKLLRDARTLKTKAIGSLRTAMTAFTSYDDAGRVTMVLMHSQHACEMLLKAVSVQSKAGVFDKRTGRAIGFERCLGLCVAHYQLTTEEASIMRAIDAQRAAAQHWFVYVSEYLLYMQIRALITAFDPRQLPLLTAICVNQSGLQDGELEKNALSGFAEGSRRIGRSFAD